MFSIILIIKLKQRNLVVAVDKAEETTIHYYDVLYIPIWTVRLLDSLS